MKKKTYVRKDVSGFTIIEVLVTMVVLAILVSFAIPVFSRWLPGYRLKGAARDVFSNIQLAKLEAIKRGGDCIITLDTGANTYSIDMADGTHVKTVTLVDYGSGVSFGGGGTSSSSISFSSRGLAAIAPVPADSKGKVYLTNIKNTSKYLIEVTTAGSISIDRL